MKFNKQNLHLIGLLLVIGMATSATADKQQFSQAMDLKTEAVKLFKEEKYVAAGEHYEQAVQMGLSSEYGYWKAIDSYVKAGALEKALKPMSIMAENGATTVSYYQMLAEPFKNDFKQQYQNMLTQVKDNAAQAKLTNKDHNNKAGQIYTQDVKRFFQAFEEAEGLVPLADKRRVYERLYFNKASEGMVDYVSMKISGIDNFVAYVEKNRVFYEDVEAASHQLNDLIPVAKQAMEKMKTHYPAAPSSDIYFVVGMHTSAGTASGKGILLGADFIAAGKENISGLKDWTHPYITEAEEKVWVVVHEYVHVLQNTGHETVLGNALVEGGADFLANLLYAPPKQPSLYTKFGLANEQLVKQKFKAQMAGTDISLWTGNNSKELPENWVPDLGYFVGHQIAKAYYDQAADKSQAIRDLLKLQNPGEILKQSGYLDDLD